VNPEHQLHVDAPPSAGRYRVAPLVLALLGLGLTGCSSSLPGHPGSRALTTAAAVPPTPAAVDGGRFVAPVELDDGTLLVEPPTADEQPTISEAQAATEIWASSAFTGYHQGFLAYGVVTITMSAPGVPTVTSLPAWVGFAMGNAASCPAMTAPTRPTTTEQPAPTPGYSAVVIGAGSGVPAVAYRARGALCGAPPTGPTVSAASEVLSVPWVATGPLVPNSPAVLQVTLPSCGALNGYEAEGSPSSFTITVPAVVPDDRSTCQGTKTGTVTVQIGAPPGARGLPPMSSTAAITHGVLGPLQQASSP
jgi:hypothetical protein